MICSSLCRAPFTGSPLTTYPPCGLITSKYKTFLECGTSLKDGLVSDPESDDVGPHPHTKVSFNSRCGGRERPGHW